MPSRTRPITRAAIVAAARRWIGTPYHHRAACRGAGTDCLGLLRGIWREAYGTEPEIPPAYTRDWAEASGRETLLEAAGRHLVAIDAADARAGDVLLFRLRPGLPAKHIGLISGPDRMIHAVETAPVAEVVLQPWWRRRIAAAFGFPGVDD